jgi:hypothetical protein
MKKNLKDLTDDWLSRIDSHQKAHYGIAGRFESYHYLIGLPATVLSTIAGATLFSEITDPRIKMAIGVLGLLAAVLSAIQTFYSHAKRSEVHRFAAAQLGQIRRDIEILQQLPPENDSELDKKVHEINDRLSAIDKEAPVVIVKKGYQRFSGLITLGGP